MTFTLTTGPVTDYLVGLAQAAVVGVTVGGVAAVAVDGYPVALVPGMFAVGIAALPPELVGETHDQMLPVATGPTYAEQIDVPCVIDCRLSGTQKQARDAAETIFNAFATALFHDLTLGGRVTQGTVVNGFTSTPHFVGTVAEPGHRQVLAFTVSCANRQLLT